MKFFKKNRLSLTITIVLLVMIVLVVVIRQQKEYQKNPGLIPPKWDYDAQVVLTDQQKSVFEADLKKYNDLIINFVVGTWEQEIDLGNGVKGTTKIDQKPNSAWFIEKARALENLWRYSESIATYNDLFRLYDNNSVGRINLWELYETIHQPELAILQYIKLLEAFPNFDKYYYKKIVRLSLKLNNPEQAGQRYIKYEQLGWTRDEELMKQIKEMKKE